MGRLGSFETILQDLRFAARLLSKNLGFASVVVLTLALAIGANVAVFTLVNAVLFKSLPFTNPDRIVSITSNNLPKNQEQLGASYLDFQDWRAQSNSFTGLAAAQWSLATLVDPGLPTEAHESSRVSANSFSVLGQQVLLGRDFLPHEDQGTGADVAILGYGLWQGRYGGDPNILGRVIRVNEVPTTVIGVMPEGMKFPYNQDIWIPLVATGPSSSLLKREQRYLLAFGRLTDGVSTAQAQTEMDLIAKRLQQEYPNSNENIGVRIGPYEAFFTRSVNRTLFLAMLGAVGFVLLIACANVANLLLSRSLARGREASIRAALGATRGRIVQQLLIESLLLGVLGTIAGLILSIWGVRSFAAAMSDQQIPYWVDFSMDYTVFLYLAAICVVTTVLFGLAPALQASKVELSHALKEGARGTGGGHTRYLSRILVVSEVSLALVLLVGAGLMVRSFLHVYRLGTGSENEKVLTMRINFNGGGYLDAEPRIKILERLEPELRRTPGVETVALASSLPQDWAMPWQFDLDGQSPPADPNDRPSVTGVEISSEYFGVLGVPLLRGRSFEPNEGRNGNKVAIVNQRFVNRYWPGQDPIGKRINIVRFNKSERWVTVVGEVTDVKHKTWPNPNESEMEPTIYVPYLQDQEGRWIAILASTKGDAHSLAVPLRSAVQRVADLAVRDVMTLPEHAAKERWFTRLYGSLFAIFALIGIVLSAVGIYAVMSYSVSQRTQEIGIRMALGAQPQSVLKLVLGQGFKLAAIGVSVGLAGSYAITRVMAKLLIGVQPTDPATFIAVALLLTTISLIACYLPARRATRVDPMLALRSE